MLLPQFRMILLQDVDCFSEHNKTHKMDHYDRVFMYPLRLHYIIENNIGVFFLWDEGCIIMIMMIVKKCRQSSKQN